MGAGMTVPLLRPSPTRAWTFEVTGLGPARSLSCHSRGLCVSLGTTLGGRATEGVRSVLRQISAHKSFPD